MIATRECSICRVEYPVTSEYYYRWEKCKTNDGFDYRCKNCSKINDKKRYDPKKKRNANLKKYDLTLEGYNKMLSNQNGVCLICEQEETKGNQFGVQPLSVDHNHKTGEVRGLLCKRCNTFLGICNDDIPYLSRFLYRCIKYLKGEL